MLSDTIYTFDGGRNGVAKCIHVQSAARLEAKGYRLAKGWSAVSWRCQTADGCDILCSDDYDDGSRYRWEGCDKCLEFSISRRLDYLDYLKGAAYERRADVLGSIEDAAKGVSK